VRREVAALGLAIMLPAFAGANAIVVPGLARAAPQRPSDPGLVCGPSGVAEDFHKVVYKSPSDPQRPGMWFINFGNGQQYYDKHGAYAARGESSSILRETEGTTDFLRTQLVPDTSFEGKYVDV
jgi:hypothetical protein